MAGNPTRRQRGCEARSTYKSPRCSSGDAPRRQGCCGEAWGGRGRPRGAPNSPAAARIGDRQAVARCCSRPRSGPCSGRNGVATAGRDEGLTRVRRIASFDFGRHVGARDALPDVRAQRPRSCKGLNAPPPANAARTPRRSILPCPAGIQPRQRVSCRRHPRCMFGCVRNRSMRRCDTPTPHRMDQPPPT
jgi:hypothetical protein